MGKAEHLKPHKHTPTQRLSYRWRIDTSSLRIENPQDTPNPWGIKGDRFELKLENTNEKHAIKSFKIIRFAGNQKKELPFTIDNNAYNFHGNNIEGVDTFAFSAVSQAGKWTIFVTSYGNGREEMTFQFFAQAHFHKSHSDGSGGGYAD